MQSSSSQILSGFLRNPSILAMIGSAGIHGLLVLFSGLKPAESLPTPLRIISIDPGSGSSNSTNLNALLAPNGLPVPNGLPPISLGDDVPVGPNAMDISKGSPFIGSSSNPFGIGLGDLKTTDTPQKSVLGNQAVVKVPIPKPPNTGLKNSAQSQAGGQTIKGKFQGQPDFYPEYKTQAKPMLPKLPGSSGTSSTTVASASSAPSPSSGPAPLAGDAAAAQRDGYVAFLKNRGEFYKQTISTQPARITATYPAEACNSKSSDSAQIAAIFRPDGSFTNNDKDIALMGGASSNPLTQVALAAVRDYRIPNPAGIYQALNFKVDIPYSEAVCNSKSIPETPVKSAPSPTENIPSPSPTPRSSARKPTSKEEFLNSLKFQTPKIGASPSPSSKVPSVLDGVNIQRSEPLPSSSPMVPEGAPKSP